ncbi:MAG: hypothetical protein ACKO34_06790 [Vampirovibrionales bacterium]
MTDKKRVGGRADTIRPYNRTITETQHRLAVSRNQRSALIAGANALTQPTFNASSHARMG